MNPDDLAKAIEKWNTEHLIQAEMDERDLDLDLIINAAKAHHAMLTNMADVDYWYRQIFDCISITDPRRDMLGHGFRLDETKLLSVISQMLTPTEASNG